MTTTKIKLLTPTDRTEEGPRLTYDRDRLTLEYDYQQDDGSLEWRKIVFGEVLAVEYRQGICCTADSIIGAREIRVSTNSTWLAEVLEPWQHAVGWHEWQEEQGGAARFRHFTVYFDDAACIDVISSSCNVE